MSAETMIRDFLREFPDLSFTRDQELRLIELVQEETNEGIGEDWMWSEPAPANANPPPPKEKAE